MLTKILSGYLFAETRTSGGYPTLVYSILLNIATKLELWKATHEAKLELQEATLVALESYKRRCTVVPISVPVPVPGSLRVSPSTDLARRMAVGAAYPHQAYERRRWH